MNNKGTKTSVAQKRGFYIALYSILAALLILAAVISYNNYTAVNRAREMRAQIAAEELLAVSASQVESYLTQPTRSPAATPRSNAPSSGTTPRNEPNVTATPAPRTAPAAPAPRTNPATPAEQPAAPQPAPAPVAEGEEQPNQQAGPVQTPVPSADPVQHSENEPADSSSAPIPPPSGRNRSSELAPPIAEVFTEGDMMRWPVLGEVVMDFSSGALVYDRTLEQYRTNDILCIATDIGTPVLAAAGGVVRTVKNTRELGNTIVLDHGNGWATFYSQLQDGVLVSEGDVVTAGQVIGGVGSPSLYYVLLGNHLGFSVSYNDSFIDPKQLLE